MKFFRREHENITGHEVTITSWWDISDKTWHALAPRYVNVLYDQRGIRGKSREEAVGSLISYLADQLEDGE